MASNIGRQVELWRKRGGLSQSELAEAAKINRSIVWRIESGATTNPGVNTLRDIARALDITIGDLLDTELKPCIHCEGTGVVIEDFPND